MCSTCTPKPPKMESETTQNRVRNPPGGSWELPGGSRGPLILVMTSFHRNLHRFSKISEFSGDPKINVFKIKIQIFGVPRAFPRGSRFLKPLGKEFSWFFMKFRVSKICKNEVFAWEWCNFCTCRIFEVEYDFRSRKSVSWRPKNPGFQAQHGPGKPKIGCPRRIAKMHWFSDAMRPHRGGARGTMQATACDPP